MIRPTINPRRAGHWTIAAWALASIGLLSESAHAQTPEVIFDAAVSAYQRGRFDSAAVGFLSLARAGIDDARVWYNLGNSHFKAGRIGSALVAYRRGLRLHPRDADLQANLRYVSLFAVDKIEPVGVFFLEEWWRAVADRISFSEARTLAALAMWCAVLLTVGRLWPGPRPRVALWLVIAGWGLWLSATGAAASRYARDVQRRDGVIVVARADVRSGPGDSYALQFTAHDGLSGTIQRTDSAWHFVLFPNGLKGWIAAADFELI
ncbi:MAG TPA: tetratricopeptide repeat protein [candidate division Zixibacteria bacterium]|jgi:tetratricopeptide (TPR) repeat protein